MVTKPAEPVNRPAQRCRLPTLIWLLGAAPIACGEAAESVPESEDLSPRHELTWIGNYALETTTLYCRRAGAREAVAVLPGGGPGRDTLAECAVLAPELGEVNFGRLRLAPDSVSAAWSTVGPGTCVGTVAGEEPVVRVLEYRPAAKTDSLIWAPVGDYLAVLFDDWRQRAGLSVYDAKRGLRLEMPWERDCERIGGCDVEQAVWLGGSLLNVRLRLGPAERSVPFEVNVEEAASLEMEEEY